MRLSEVSRETLPLLYVVEGKNDVATLTQVFDGPILTTNGSAVSDDLIQQLLILEAKYSIVLLLDPDGPGEKIRRTLNNHLNYPVNIFIPKEIARSRNKQKVGVEHVSRETLKLHLLEPKTIQRVEAVSMLQLVELGLAGVAGASTRRTKICSVFNLGLANAKTLRHKLQMFGITYDQVELTLEGSDE
jgi:ribonuclease M5